MIYQKMTIYQTMKYAVPIFIILASTVLMTTAYAGSAGWRPTHITYCSDGAFDWDSGQSLYDFVILKRAPNDFIVSYLGISHPSFEQRRHENPWLKLSGVFSSSLAIENNRRIYTLHLNLDNEPKRIARLEIRGDNVYQFRIEPPLKRATTHTGLCWESLKDDGLD